MRHVEPKWTIRAMSLGYDKYDIKARHYVNTMVNVLNKDVESFGGICDIRDEDKADEDESQRRNGKLLKKHMIP